MTKNGKIQLYTGNGKGKTTAALGLVFRAAGSGMKSIVVQFLKGQKTGEQRAAEMLNGLVTIEQYGADSFYKPGQSDYISNRGFAKRGLDRAVACAVSGEYDLVVLDEIFGALHNGLVSYEEILSIIEIKHPDVEMIMTGRDAPSDLFERCDLVTEMNELKHYYAEGVAARKGIEF